MRRYHLRFPANNYIYPLGRDSVLVGRAEHCDITLLDKRMSREHAKIFPAESGWWLLDLGSENGTFVDDEPIDSARLTPGCKIRFDGEQECYFEPSVSALDETDTPGAGHGKIEEHLVALRSQLTGLVSAQTALVSRIDSVEQVAARAKLLSEECAADIERSGKAIEGLIEGGKRGLVAASVAGAMLLGFYTSSTIGSERNNGVKQVVDALGGPETFWSGLSAITLTVTGAAIAARGKGDED